MISLREHEYQSYCRYPKGDELTFFFSACFDETGTHNASQHTLVAAGLALNSVWDEFDSAWSALLETRNIECFHANEFNNNTGAFRGWSKLKRNRFVKRQQRILRATPTLSIAVAVDSAAHRACNFLIYAKRVFGIRTVFNGRVRKGSAPAMFAEMMNGFESVQKGRLRGTEFADYYADIAIRELRDGIFATNKSQIDIGFVMDENFLRERWYAGIVEKRDFLKAHWSKKASRNVAQ